MYLDTNVKINWLHHIINGKINKISDKILLAKIIWEYKKYINDYVIIKIIKLNKIIKSFTQIF